MNQEQAQGRRTSGTSESRAQLGERYETTRGSESTSRLHEKVSEAGKVARSHNTFMRGVHIMENRKWCSGVYSGNVPEFAIPGIPAYSGTEHVQRTRYVVESDGGILES